MVVRVSRFAFFWAFICVAFRFCNVGTLWFAPCWRDGDVDFRYRLGWVRRADFYETPNNRHEGRQGLAHRQPCARGQSTLLPHIVTLY